MSRPKIAVCLSGQPRTWEGCHSQLRQLYESWGDVDYFFHLWDFNSHAAQSKTSSMISDAEKQKIVETYQPKAFRFESERLDIVQLEPEVKNPVVPWSFSQFYSLKCVAALRQEYEFTHQIKYDIVIRSRTDLVFNQRCVFDHVDPNTVHAIHTSESRDNIWEAPVLGDIFYGADSRTFDKIACFYDYLQHLDCANVPGKHPFPPEVVFYHYVTGLGIRVAAMKWVNAKLRRAPDHETAVGPLREFEII